MPRLQTLPRLRDWLLSGDMDSLQAYAEHNHRALSFLTAMTYDQDPQIAWNAVRALGCTAAVIAESDPEYVRVHLRRFMWLLNDESGGIGWRAPESLASVIADSPDLFEEFVPVVISILDMEPEDFTRFRAGALWALGRLASNFVDQVRAREAFLAECLTDQDSQIRGLAVWCLRQLDIQYPYAETFDFSKDQGEVILLTGEKLVQTSVAQIASGMYLDL